MVNEPDITQFEQTTNNNSRSTIPNGYFHRYVGYGELLNSNVPGGPIPEPTPTGAQTTPLVNPNSVYAQKNAPVSSY